MNITCTSAVRFALVVAPKADITASIVEPILLPKTKAAESSQVKKLFAAIVRTIAVIAEDECIRAVTAAPIKTPSKSPPIPKFVRCCKTAADSELKVNVF